jgi:hypothetical protein
MLFPPEQYKPYHILQRVILRALDFTFPKLRRHQNGGAAISAE